MNTWPSIVAIGLLLAASPLPVDARVWTDSTGRYSLEAELVMWGDKLVVLQRADHELVAVPIDKLSDTDREYLESQPAAELARQATEGLQSWTLADGTQLVGRIVDYAVRPVTLHRRRGRIYVNDRVLDNLPEFYQRIVPQIVAHFESLRRADRRSLETWLVRQRGQPRTFDVEGVVLETESGDEFTVPFFLFSADDLKVLKPGWHDWREFHRDGDYDALAEHAFLLRSLAAARHRDQQVQRQVAMMNLQLQAVQAGLTSLWEVTLYPPEGRGGRPQWVVVPGRDSRQASQNAMGQFPGYAVGPIRRVAP